MKKIDGRKEKLSIFFWIPRECTYKFKVKYFWKYRWRLCQRTHDLQCLFNNSRYKCPFEQKYIWFLWLIVENCKKHSKKQNSFLKTIKATNFFTHHLWDVSLAATILKKLLYGRVGGVSRGGYSYPRILITWRLCHYFWKLPIFSFHRLLFFMFH